MTNLMTQEQVRLLAVKTGFTAEDAKIAAAIAMVESAHSTGGASYADADKEGDLHLVNGTWGPSFGLMQVRSLWADSGTGKTRDGTRLKDPAFNMKSALTIRKSSSGWGAWTTYNNEQYKAYLQKEFPPPLGVHVVKSGDNLYKIAEAYGGVFSWRDLAKVNGLVSPYTIYINQALVLPLWTYTVVKGDNLSSIARRFAKITATELAQYNKIPDPNLINVGQVIRIPHPVIV